MYQLFTQRQGLIIYYICVIQTLLASETAKERESKKLNEEIQDLLNAASAKEQMISKKFKSQGGMIINSCQEPLSV